jgi:hypothetical protein
MATLALFFHIVLFSWCRIEYEYEYNSPFISLSSYVVYMFASITGCVA